jgi:hypothetical protein
VINVLTETDYEMCLYSVCVVANIFDRKRGRDVPTFYVCIEKYVERKCGEGVPRFCVYIDKGVDSNWVTESA